MGPPGDIRTVLYAYISLLTIQYILYITYYVEAITYNRNDRTSFLIPSDTSHTSQYESSTAHHIKQYNAARNSVVPGVVTEKPSKGHAQLLVIGGGSGGIAAACRAAENGASVLLIESSLLGGTCVNAGCVPKKLLYYAGSIQETLEDAKQNGMQTAAAPFDWLQHKRARDEYIHRLNSIYGDKLKRLNITVINGDATMIDKKRIRVGVDEYTADHILIAVGSKPMLPNIRGIEYCSTSDDVFRLEMQPNRVAVIGSGYIAVELAGILSALGSNTTLFIRTNRVLRRFDDFISTHLHDEMHRQDIQLITGASVTAVTKDASDGRLSLQLNDGRSYVGYDMILMAVGRVPRIENLGLSEVGVKLDVGSGCIKIDEEQKTNLEGVYAVGDVTGKYPLAPVAVAAGRKLSDRLFGGTPTAKVSFDMIPTVIFSHPPIASIGFTEGEAAMMYGASNVTIYETSFVNLYYSLWRGPPEMKPRTKIKMVCTGKEDRVVGLHMIGMSADEILQGFAVAIKMNATKFDFDETMAIHPTAAEEIVTMRNGRPAYQSVV